MASPSQTEPKDTGPSVTIRQMFEFNRIQTYSDLFVLCFYFPIGICLFILRFFIFLNVLAVVHFLPNDSNLQVRSRVFRSIFFILGIVIQDEDVNLKNFKAQFIISNRISDFDPLIINMIYPCSYLSSSPFPRYVSWLFGISKETLAQHKNDMATVIKDNSLPVVCFPEASRTNGRVGLFKFEAWPFACNLDSHIIFIQSQNPLFNVNLSPLGASSFTNLFWLFFLPVTFFHIRYLSSVKKAENESSNDYAKRTQLEMASQTKLYASDFDKEDKKEMIKRYKAEFVVKRNIRRDETKPRTLTLEEMAIKVKEVLPQVPLNAIKADVLITKNIDDTIERILNGQIKYTPEDSQQDSQKSSSSNDSNKSNPESGKLFYCGASSFGKNAYDRSLSFQERKEHLFRIARTRYLQKLNHNSSSN